MFPSMSAYTKFWDGTSHLLRARRNWSQLSARLIPRMASTIRVGSRAVHRRAMGFSTGRAGGGPLVEVFQLPVGVGDDWAVPGAPHLEVFLLSAGDDQRFGMDVHVDPLAVDLVLVRVVGVQLLDVEVLHVGCQVCDPP